MRVAASLLCLLAALLLAAGLAAPPAFAQSAFAALYQAASKEGEVIFYTDGRQDEAQRLSNYWKANFPA